MRLTLVLSACLTVVLGRATDLQWQQYKQEYNKVYSGNEEEARRNAFEDNLGRVEEHNREADAGLHSFRLALNQFADMTNEEYKKHLQPQTSGPSLGSQYNSSSGTTRTKRGQGQPGDIPDSLDWRTSGFVGPVRDQGQLGNSVVMATIDAVEGGERKLFKTLVPLSTQQLLECCGPDSCTTSCRQTGECMLCLTQLGGVESEVDYPARQCQACSFQLKSVTLVVDGFARPDRNSELVLKADIATLGLGVASVDASNFSFQLYSGGIYDEPNCSSVLLDHAMVIVGYGTENGKDFWIVKNSWGSGWGEQGYIRMSRNNGNQCGIASDVWFPLVSQA